MICHEEARFRGGSPKDAWRCGRIPAARGLDRSSRNDGSALGVADEGADDALLAAVAVALLQRGVLRLAEPRRGGEAVGAAEVAAVDGEGGDGEGAGATKGDGGSGRFRYTKTVTTGDTAVLEFETTVDGKYVNGVDIIRGNDQGRIVEFRVMIRPLQAVNLVHQQMAAMLERMNSAG